MTRMRSQVRALYRPLSKLRSPVTNSASLSLPVAPDGESSSKLDGANASRDGLRGCIEVGVAGLQGVRRPDQRRVAQPPATRSGRSPFILTGSAIAIAPSVTWSWARSCSGASCGPPSVRSCSPSCCAHNSPAATTAPRTRLTPWRSHTSIAVGPQRSALDCPTASSVRLVLAFVMWQVILRLFRGTEAQNPVAEVPQASAKLPSVFEPLRSRSKFRQGVGTGDRGVRQLELACGVQLPSTLRDMIAACGWLELGDHVVLRGVDPRRDPSRDIQAAIEADKTFVSMRRCSHGKLLPLMCYGFGHEACLLYRDGDDSGVGPVVLWPPHSAQTEKDLERVDVLASSFDEWSAQLVRGETGPW